MDKKIKIAIATHKMVMGGIEKSLIQLVKVLIKRRIEVDVFVEIPGGELYDELAAITRVKNIFEDYSSTFEVVSRHIRHAEFKKAQSAIHALFLNRLNRNPIKAWEATANFLDEPFGKYDYAFAYGAPVSFSVIFVDKLLCSKRKFVWIHNEVDQISLDIRKYKQIFKNYEKIICVSKGTRATFLKVLPEYENKTFVFYNIIDRDTILKKARDNARLDGFSGIRLLTVGRLSYEKGQDIIPLIAQRLVKNGYNIRWYCIGEGEERERLEHSIKRLKMESRVILIGNQSNPYPFFKMADIYVQPSRQEGFGITIAEAKCFELPIIVTDFLAAHEQIIDGKTGLIVPFNEKSIYEKITMILENNSFRRELSENLKNDGNACRVSLDSLLE